MLISDASIRRHLGEHDASLTHLACFRRHRVAAHVSISGSVATYLIGAREKGLGATLVFRPPTRSADDTSFSCCLMRTKTEPIEKCSYRRSNGCVADDSMTHSPRFWSESAHLHASACERLAIGYVLLHMDNTERSEWPNVLRGGKNEIDPQVEVAGREPEVPDEQRHLTAVVDAMDHTRGEAPIPSIRLAPSVVLPRRRHRLRLGPTHLGPAIA
jgi:hypothetical protein